MTDNHIATSITGNKVVRFKPVSVWMTPEYIKGLSDFKDLKDGGFKAQIMAVFEYHELPLGDGLDQLLCIYLDDCLTEFFQFIKRNQEI